MHGPLGHEETAGDQPRADRRAAEEQEASDRDAGIRKQARGAPRSGHDPFAAPREHERRDQTPGRGDGPGLVARKARAGKREACRVRHRWSAARDPEVQPVEPDERQPQQQRFCHRRALQVEHVRVQREAADGDERCGARRRRAQDQAGACPRGDGIRQHREGDRRGAGPVEEVDLNEAGVEQVRQGQPHRADLPPARREAVGDATGHHEPRARVVVNEREPVEEVEERGPRADGERRDADEPGQAAIGCLRPRPQGLDAVHVSPPTPPSAGASLDLPSEARAGSSRGAAQS